MLLHELLCDLVDVAVESDVRLVLEPGDRLGDDLAVPLERHLKAATITQRQSARTFCPRCCMINNILSDTHTQKK